MKVLPDHNVTRQLKRLLFGHFVRSAAEESWEALSNGDLIRAAEANGYAVLITADQGIFYQQSNMQRKIALVVLTSNRQLHVLQQSDVIRLAISRATQGSYEVVKIPLPPKVR